MLYYVHNDPLGTPQALTDESGTVVWTAQYDPFGKATVDENPDGDVNAVTLNVRFPGQHYDQETGLHYNYFRYYDPGTGRYLTSDPIGLDGGLNTYSYVFQNPIRSIDTDGLRGASSSVIRKFIEELVQSKAGDQITSPLFEDMIKDRQEATEQLGLIGKLMQQSKDRRFRCDRGCMDLRDTIPCFDFDGCWVNCWKTHIKEMNELNRQRNRHEDFLNPPGMPRF